MKKFLALFILPLFISCGSSTKLVWRWILESRCYAQPVLEGKNVYVVSQAGEVISGEIQTGKKHWSAKVNGPILGDPDYDKDHVFVATQNGSIFSLRKNDGSVQWNVNFPDENFTAPLTVVREMLLAPSRNGTLYALSREDGRIIWKHEGNKKYNTKVIVSEPYLFIGGWADDFYSFHMDGSVNWRYKASHVIVENALVQKNVVYFTAHDSHVYALDIPTGRLKWRFRADNEYPTEMVPIGQELVFGSADFLEVVDSQTGKRIRRIKAPRIIDRLYFWKERCIVVSKKVYAIDPKSGESTVIIPGKGPYFKVAFAQDRFVVTDEERAVYGYSVGN